MIATTLSGHRCRLCAACDLHEFERFRELTRVTSDSRPWTDGGRLVACRECGAVQKLVDPNWLNDIDRIYQSYVLYHQADGKEQRIFAGNGAAPRPRSVSLLEYLEDRLGLPRRADVLDFGCGTGAALRTFSSRYPDWTLWGADLSARSLALLQDIPGFTDLFTCPPAGISRRFDLITMIHTLEHVLDPVETLRGLVGRLTDGGTLFVQVPDGARTPYDLVIADHLLHFTQETLRGAAERAGCSVRDVSDTVLPKELSLLVRAGEGQSSPFRTPDPERAIERTSAQVDWLFAQVAAAAAVARDSRRFGVFGTSISATWLAGALGDRVSFFVDEDRERVGRHHMERPVLAAHDAPADSDVFVPLIPDVAASVARRLSTPDRRFHALPFEESGRSC